MTPTDTQTDAITIPRADVERARAGYAWDVRNQWNVSASVAAIRRLTAALGGLQVRDYVHVLETDLHGALNVTAPSDRHADLDGAARLRVIDVGTVDDRVFVDVVRPDSYATTGQVARVLAADAIWAL